MSAQHDGTARHPLRVVIVSRIYRPEPSAASLFLGSVSDALLEQSIEVEVLTAKPLPGQGTGSRGERVRTFPVLRDKRGYVRGYLQYMSFDIPLMFRLLFTRRPSIVFVEPPPTTGAAVRIICAIRRIPYVYDAADIWSDAAAHATSSQAVVRVLRFIEKFAMRGAKAMVTISQGVVERVAALDIDTPITVTGFGADTSTFYHSDLPLKQTFIYAGTYTELHGASILVDAFALFTETHHGYILQFIGNGNGQDEMVAKAHALGVAGQVQILESVPADQLRPMLNSAISSLATLDPNGGYEYAFTSKAYSSLASGCPVIFAGPGPTIEFMRTAAEHAPVGESVDYGAEAIAEAMRNAADNPLSTTERGHLATWAAENHSMMASARKVREVLVRTISAQGGT